MRYQGGVKSDILTDVKAGDKVVILEEMENWSKVATSDGFLGYVENKRLENLRSETLIPVTDYQEPEYTSIRRDHKISLGWHQVTSEAANSTLSTVLDGVSGMNVISPTWFFLSDNAVSYTHLDVYKRQVKTLVEGGNAAGQRCGRAFRASGLYLPAAGAGSVNSHVNMAHAFLRTGIQHPDQIVYHSLLIHKISSFYS